MTATWPAALTIAGSDSSGGAGIQADLKTFCALGVYGATVITALTAQNTQGVRAVDVTASPMVQAQLDAVLDDIPIGAVKTGMLANAEVIDTVARTLSARPDLALVVDPVMVATSGDRLLDPAAIGTLKSKLLPLATLVTPNLPEAAALLGCEVAATVQRMAEQAQAILAFGCKAVLIKGGHGSGEEAIDVLVTPAGARRLATRRIQTRNTHGTGCTLSAAITAHLARGAPLDAAVTEAKAYLTAALKAAALTSIGKGAGPVDHLYRLRRPPG
jgi:hydroxymethylpyrimidine/phosphomethylpyrimidine kinase